MRDYFDLVRKAGAEPLSVGETGYRQISNSKRPMIKPDDMKGIKVRVVGSPMYGEIMSGMGANPTFMSWADAQPALASGAVDAQENPLEVFLAAKIHTLGQKYVTKWNYSNDILLKEGDVIAVDCGVYYKGYHSDSAYTYPLEGVNVETLQLLERTYESLFKGIEQAKAGNRMGDISYAIQSHVESFGYGVVRELVGHGVGKKLHEDPEVPNYGKRGRGVKLVEGMVIAIEPMINQGTKRVVQERDGWTIRTMDRKPSAHCEHMVAIGKESADILTTHEYIEKNYSYKWRNKSQ
jgi:hypothetical protein